MIVGTSALRFKAPWQTAMTLDVTPSFTFTGDDGQGQKIRALRVQTQAQLAQSPTETVVTLPYEGGAMALVLAKPTGALSDWVQALDANRLAGWTTGTQGQQGQLTLAMPPFSLRSTQQLGDTLAGLGASGLAFSFFDDGSQQALGDIYAQAAIDVDEAGTEAVAATAFTGVETAAPATPGAPWVVNLDGPFMFFVVDRFTGTILFMGRMTDPSAAPLGKE